MNEIIYLETDEEITSVIDRLRKSKQKCLALVIPRGGTLAQSIVNLKLLKKSANELGKEISLVSNDRVSRNLASQIGLTVYSKTQEAEKAGPIEKKVVPTKEEKGDFKVNSYYGKESETEEEDSLAADETEKDEVEDDFNEPDDDSVSDGDDNEDEPKKIEKEEIEKSYKEPEEETKPKEDRKPTRNEEAAPKGVSASAHGKEDGARSGGGDIKKPMSRNKKIVIGIISGCVLLLLAVAYIFLPFASAKVLVKTEDLNVSETVVISPIVTAVDREKLVIPATKVEIEKEISKTYKSTGTKEMGEKATGKITVSNNYDGNVQNIPAGSKFVSGAKTFVSLSAVDLPGITDCKFVAGSLSCNIGKADVNVEAESTGETYNLGPSDFVITTLPPAKQNAIKGHSVSAMTGGTTKTINVVSDTDFKNAEADLTKSITDLGKTELAAKAKDEKLEIVEAKIESELLSKEASKNINDEADSFDYRVKMKLTVIAYNIEDIRNVLIASAERTLAIDKMLIGQDKFEATAEFVGDVKVAEEGTESGALEVKGSLKGKTGQKISDKQIKDQVKNKKYAEAKTIIEKYDRVESVNLQIWPSSIARVPMITSRIKVTFDYAE